MVIRVLSRFEFETLA